MATRPVFLVGSIENDPVIEKSIDFTWHAGLSLAQKQKSIASLHEAGAQKLQIQHMLEVSTKSTNPLGRELSVFNLLLTLADGRKISVESAFQGSKVFSGGGPYVDLFDLSSREAKTDVRLQQSGNLTGFRFAGHDYPLTPKTLFYDWIYTQAVSSAPGLIDRLSAFDAFTDIEFNPKKSINCQARTCAYIAALAKAKVENFADDVRVFRQYYADQMI